MFKKAAPAPTATPAAPKKTTTVKKQAGGKKKKITLKFTIDCSHPVEDGIFDMKSFVSVLNITSNSAAWGIE